MDKFFFDKALNIFFPAKCGFCEDITGNYKFICDKCIDKQMHYEDKCFLCGNITYLKNNICKECLKKKIYYDRLIFCNEYEGTIQDKIVAYKFYGKKYLYHFFTELLYERLKAEVADIIIPVPISKRRMNERGYNQAAIIAKKLSVLLDIKYNKNTLVKIKDTKRQSNLSKEERYKNIINSFKLADIYDIANKSVILIDDVFTTGVTANECSKELRRGGAYKITVATIAVARHSQNGYI